MSGENLNTQNQEQSPTENQWDNLAQEVPFTGDSAEQHSVEPEADLGTKVQETLNTMDKRTSNYIWQLGSNIATFFGISSPNPEDQKFAKDFTDALNQALAGDNLKNAYLSGTGILRTGAAADRARELEDPADGDAVYIPKSPTDKPTEHEPTGNQYADNLDTLDARTRNYIQKWTTNMGRLFENSDFSQTCFNYIQQAIAKGTLNGAYLDNSGTLREGKVADEYREYDSQK